MTFFKTVCRLGELGFISLFAFSCNPRFESQIYTDKLVSFSSKYSGIGYNTYISSLYSFAQTQGCVKCHESRVTPNFASRNPDRAYESALGNLIGSQNKLIDFTNVTDSEFLEKAGDGHCNEQPCSDPAVRTAMEKVLGDWAQAELASGNTAPRGPASTNPVKFMTVALKVPATIPTILVSAAPAVLRFNLGQLKPTVAGLENAILEIELKMANPNVFRINRPKIIGAAREFLFSNITVFIKTNPDPAVVGKEDSSYASHWHDVVRTAAVVAKPATLPAGPINATPLVDAALYYETVNKDDYLTIGFGDIR